MGLAGSRGRRRSTLARGKGRNWSEGAGAFVKNAVGDRRVRVGFITGFGADLTTGPAPASAPRFTTGRLLHGRHRVDG